MVDAKGKAKANPTANKKNDRPVRFRVVPQEEGMMLANLLARRLPDANLQQAKDLVKAGAVYMGHLRVRVPTVRVVPGERITAYPTALDHEPLPPDALRFIHRERDFVVLDKPAGVPVSATRQSARGTLSEALRRYYEHRGIVRPYVGVVHRLDREATGLVLFTIRSVANKSLHKQFVEHTLRRSYRLLVQGQLKEESRCDLPIVERPGGGARVAQDGETRARSASTRFRPLRSIYKPPPGMTLVEAELETGRLHQIRVHAAASGFPVYGDRRYGDAAAQEVGLHLHASRLEFEHPVEGDRMELRAPLPDWAKTADDPPRIDYLAHEIVEEELPPSP